MKVWVGLELWADEVYDGTPKVFLSLAPARKWESEGPGPDGETWWREIHEVEAQ